MKIIRMASAKKIRDEIMSMTIVVNSNPAQQEIYKLSQRSKELTTESKKLTKEREKVAQTLGKESQEYKDLTQKIKDNNTELTINKSKVKDLTDSLDINQMTVKQLRQELGLLNKELRERAIPGTDQYDALQKRISEVDTRLKEVKKGADDAGGGFEYLSETFNEYGGSLAVALGTLAGITVTIQEVIDRNNEMADAMSAVEKTTGMTTNEVKGLSQELKNLDTRTKQLDLLKIAEVGGRLGVAKNEILDFTREVDKAYVALGDSWNGGVDDLADSLGKIASIYKETKDLPIAESINQIGSALNELAANGASSEQNIADFVNRLGSMPPAMKPSLNTLLGFGSAFEESGINAEIASSGFSKFVRVASSNAAGFAQIMKLPVSQVKEMINTDPATFFLKFSEGLKGLDGTQVEAILENLKLSDNEVQRVIGSATENTDKFKDAVETANQAVKDGTSLTDEFNKVNNNAAAIYEKIQKKFAESFTSKAVAEFLESTVTLFGQFLGVVDDANGAMTWYRNTLITLVKIVAIATATFYGMNLVTGVYNTLLKETYTRVLGLTVVEKARNFITAASNGLTTLYTASLMLMSAGYNFVTGNTLRASAAMRAFNASLAANPVGAAVTLITILASAFFLLRDNTEDATQQIKELSYEAKLNKNITDEQTKSVSELKSKIDPYISVLKDEKSQLSDRKKAYEDLIKIHPEFKGTLDAEYRATDRLNSVYDTLISNIKKAAEARALQAMLEEQYKKLEKLKVTSEYIEEDRKDLQPTTTATIGGKKVELKGSVDPKTGEKLKFVNTLAANTNKAIQEVTASTDDLVKKIASLAEKDDTKSNYLVPKTAEEERAAKEAEAARKKAEKERLAKERKAQQLAKQEEDERNKMKKDSEAATQLASELEVAKSDAVVEAMQEGFEKELAQIDIQEQRKTTELNKKKVGQTEIDILQKKIDQAKGDDKILFQALMDSWVKNNADLENLKISQTAVFEAKRKALRAKTDIEDLKHQDESKQREVAELQRQKNDELAQYSSLAELKKGLQDRISTAELNQIKTWNDGKEALTRVYQKKEIDLQVAHLQEMMALYEGLDMSLLNKDQQEQVLKFLDEAKTKVSELKSKGNENDQTNKESLKGKTKLGNQGSTDVLGMSVDDWDTFFSNLDTGANKLGTISAAIGALQQAFSTYYSYVQQKEQAQLKQVDTNAKKKELRLKKMLDSGVINQEQYDAEVQRLNQETELEKYKLEYDSAKRQRNYMIAQTQANTAMAIMNIWATANNPWVAAAMSIVVGALGLIQVANIAKQPLPEAPGFEDGYGMNYDMQRAQDGKKFNVVRKPLRSGPVYRPTHFIAGENNKMEMVIDNQTYKGFSPSFRKALHNEIAYSRGSQGFEGGYYPYLSQNQNPSNESMYAEVIANNTAAMNDIKNKSFRAYVVKDMDSAKNTIEMIDEYNQYKNQAKKR